MLRRSLFVEIFELGRRRREFPVGIVGGGAWDCREGG